MNLLNIFTGNVRYWVLEETQDLNHQKKYGTGEKTEYHVKLEPETLV